MNKEIEKLAFDKYPDGMPYNGFRREAFIEGAKAEADLQKQSVDVSAEEILKKWFNKFKNENPSENMMTWEEALSSPEMSFYLAAMEEYAFLNKKESVGNEWISVEKELPECLETVWISNGKGWTTLGCRSDYQEGDNGELNWCWAASNGIVYEENGELISECEEDDLDVQFWHRVPKPPIQSQPK